MFQLTDIHNLSFQGYKSYADMGNVFIPQLCNFNVIIGKNNTGKTSFIDVIEYLINPAKFIKRFPSVALQWDVVLDEEHLSIGFQDGYVGPHGSLDVYRKRFVGSVLRINCPAGSKDPKWSVEHKDYNSTYYANDWQRIVLSYTEQLTKYRLLRIAAERDIQPEAENSVLDLTSHGIGASNLIRAFLHQYDLPEQLIERQLLDGLNSIMGEDAIFTRIQSLQQTNSSGVSVWEVYLEEQNSGRFALSGSGSGLKTILLVLLNLLVLPELPEYKGKKLIFAFEELENNLHPALQRRLFNYLYHYSIENDCPVFLTTHSHVVIDMFYNKEKSQLLHVTKRNHSSAIKKIDNRLDKFNILEDLAIKASDLFQSNGIIWVEGPTDRIYIKRWLELFFGDKFQEGRHFQFLYYGGRLLSHYTTTEDIQAKINILTINRNAAIVMDSDRKNTNTKINQTKIRIRKEFDKLNMFCWVTAGKEIENYLPSKVFSAITTRKITIPLARFSDFSTYITPVYPNFENNKFGFANRIISHLTYEDCSKVLDLKKQLHHLYKEIEKWNS